SRPRTIERSRTRRTTCCSTLHRWTKATRSRPGWMPSRPCSGESDVRDTSTRPTADETGKAEAQAVDDGAADACHPHASRDAVPAGGSVQGEPCRQGPWVPYRAGCLVAEGL